MGFYRCDRVLSKYLMILSSRTTEFLAEDICGPGFKSVSEINLVTGQSVYVTHNGRELKGRVVRHDADSHDVILEINEVRSPTHHLS